MKCKPKVCFLVPKKNIGDESFKMELEWNQNQEFKVKSIAQIKKNMVIVNSKQYGAWMKSIGNPTHKTHHAPNLGKVNHQ
jgi:PDZ domain-containing secreted protein